MTGVGIEDDGGVGAVSDSRGVEGGVEDRSGTGASSDTQVVGFGEVLLCPRTSDGPVASGGMGHGCSGVHSGSESRNCDPGARVGGEEFPNLVTEGDEDTYTTEGNTDVVVGDSGVGDSGEDSDGSTDTSRSRAGSSTSRGDPRQGLREGPDSHGEKLSQGESLGCGRTSSFGPFVPTPSLLLSPLTRFTDLVYRSLSSGLTGPTPPPSTTLDPIILLTQVYTVCDVTHEIGILE